ncbi:MAG: AraC family transcriptional regulator [Alphaproteobacteria bacterium]|nr:AraC family transcriptional regulator [Alphaproteobacteria bacterium]
MRHSTPSPDDARLRLLAALDRPYGGDELFDAVSDTVFFLKDAKGRYAAVNQTLVARTGAKDKSELIGRTAGDVFRGVLGERIMAQDLSVITSGRPVHGQLELHLYPGGEEGWCLTWKEPLMGRDRRVVGLCGISRDLQAPSRAPDDLTSLSRAIDYLHEHIDAPLRVGDLAKRAGLSTFQLDLRMRALFGVTTGQYLMRARIELACSRLRHSTDSISRIAQDCGYSDQAAFTRQFRKSVRLTPSQYRKLHARNAAR